LEVQAPQGAAPRKREVVLHKIGLQAMLAIPALVPQFHEKASRISENGRFDDDESL
jgi:hypothetical protein